MKLRVDVWKSVINSKRTRGYLIKPHTKNSSNNNNKVHQLLQDLKSYESEPTQQLLTQLDSQLKRGGSDEVFETYKKLKELEVSFTENQVDRILSKLQISPPKLRVERVLDVLNFTNVDKPSNYSLSVLFYSLVSTYRFEESKLVLNNAKESGKELSTTSQIYLIKYYLLKSKTLSGVRLSKGLQHFFESVNSNSDSEDGLVTGSDLERMQLILLEGFLTRGDFINMMELFWQLINKKIYIPISLIERIAVCLIRGNKLMDSLDLLQHLKSKDITLRLSTYIKLMEKLNATSKFQDSINLYNVTIDNLLNKHIDNAEIKIKLKCRLLLVEAYLELEDVIKATEIYENLKLDTFYTEHKQYFDNINTRIHLKLQKIGVSSLTSPDLPLKLPCDLSKDIQLSQQLEHHLNLGGIEMAEHYFSLILNDRAFDQVPTKIYNSLLKGYLHARVNQFQWLFDLIVHNKVISDKLTYEFMFKILATVSYRGKAPNLKEKVDILVDDAEESEQIDTEKLAAARKEEEEQIRTQLSAMASKLYRQLQLEAFLPTINTFKYAMVTLTYLKKFGVIQEILIHCIQTDTYPNVDLINLTLKELLELDQFEEALTLLNQLHSHAITPKLQNFTYLIQNRILNNRMDEVDLVFKSIQQLQLVPDLHLLTRVIKGYLDRNELHRCIQYYRHLKTYDLQPDAVLTSALTQVLVRSRQYSEARKLVESMPQHNLQIDVVNLTALISPNLIRTGSDDLEKFLQYVYSLNIQPDDRMYLALIKALVSKTSLQSTLNYLVRIWRELNGFELIWEHLLVLANRKVENLKAVAGFVVTVDKLGYQVDQKVLKELIDITDRLDLQEMKLQLEVAAVRNENSTNVSSEDCDVNDPAEKIVVPTQG